MLSLLMILAEASALTFSQAPAPVAVPRGLKDLPNLTIEYYDVTGKDGRSIDRSMTKQAPKAPGSKKGATASTNWNLDAAFTQRTADGKCTISKADLTFTGKAVLPRHTDEASVPAPVLAEWRKFVGGLETTAASDLWFVHDRVGTVEKAIVGSSCEGANAAGMAAIDQLKKEEAEFKRKNIAAQTTAERNRDRDRERRGETVTKPEGY